MDSVQKHFIEYTVVRIDNCHRFQRRGDVSFSMGMFISFKWRLKHGLLVEPGRNTKRTAISYYFTLCFCKTCSSAALAPYPHLARSNQSTQQQVHTTIYCHYSKAAE